MNIFYLADTITAEQCIMFYSATRISPHGRRKMCLCPIHAEKTPSCMIDEKGRFYCFGCHAGGNSIAFVKQFFGISAKEAADKIIADFRLDENRIHAEMDEEIYKRQMQQSIRIRREKEMQRFDTLACAYLRFTKDAVSTLENDEDHLWEALREREKMLYICDLLLTGSENDRTELYEKYKTESEELWSLYLRALN